MGPILPADMLHASGKKEGRTEWLTFIECHAKKKKIWISSFSWKSKDLPSTRIPPPLGCFSSPGQHQPEPGSGCPLWRARVLCSSSPSPWEPS